MILTGVMYRFFEQGFFYLSQRNEEQQILYYQVQISIPTALNKFTTEALHVS